MSSKSKIDPKNIYDEITKEKKKPTNCPHCSGRGWISGIGEVSCGDCAGTGRDMRSDLYSEPCRGCNGRGTQLQHFRNICANCGGSGIIFS